MGNPVPIQVRSVDPYSSYDSNVVNKLTRMISDGKNILLLPSPIYVEKLSDTVLISRSGKAIMDDVLIETQDMQIDMSDSDFYVDVTGGVWNENGYYYIVLCYEYEKKSPPPTASIKIIKPSQRATVYNPSKHLFIAAVNCSGNIIISVHNYDPDDQNIKRIYAGGGAEGTKVKITEIGNGAYTVKEDDDVLMADSTNGVVQITLPNASVSSKILRIIKKSADSNLVTITSGTIENESVGTVSLSVQWDSITLMPYQAGNIWIRV